MFEPDPAKAGRRVEVWSWHFAKENVETVNDLFRAVKHADDMPSV